MTQNPFFLAAFRTLLLAAVAALVIASACVWLVPVESVQQQAFEAAGSDVWDRFEAMGRAEAFWWLLRVVLPVLCAVCAVALRRIHAATGWMHSVLCDFAAVTGNSPGEPEESAGSRRRFATILARVFLAGWLALALFHFGAGIWQRICDWPYYRTASGADVLPNMSQSNRDVIRYLQTTTGPNSRVLVVSDQRLYFLSYYLLPRRLFHPMHPQSEFEIPMAHQTRQLAAYRLEDLDADYLGAIDPDYVLEYFEGQHYVDGKRLMEDPAWVQFVRSLYGPDYVPSYTVCLHDLRQDVP